MSGIIFTALVVIFLIRWYIVKESDEDLSDLALEAQGGCAFLFMIAVLYVLADAIWWVLNAISALLSA